MAFFSSNNNFYQNTQNYTSSKTTEQQKINALRQNISLRSRSNFNVTSNNFESAELNYFNDEPLIAFTENYNYVSINYPYNQNNIICTLTNDITDYRNFVFRRAWVPATLTKTLFYNEREYLFDIDSTEDFYEWTKTITINQQITSAITDNNTINLDGTIIEELSTPIFSTVTFRGTKKDALLWGIPEILEDSTAPMSFRGYEQSWWGGRQIFNQDDKRFKFIYGEGSLSTIPMQVKPSTTSENPLSHQIGTLVPTAWCGSFLVSPTQRTKFIEEENGSIIHGLTYTSGIGPQRNVSIENGVSFGVQDTIDELTELTKQNLFSLEHDVKYRLILEVEDLQTPDIAKLASTLPFPDIANAIFPGYTVKIIKPVVQQIAAKTVSPRDSIEQFYNITPNRFELDSREVSSIPPDLRDFIWKEWPNRENYSTYPNTDYEIRGLYSSQNLPLNNFLNYDSVFNEYIMLGESIDWILQPDTGKNTRNWPGFAVNKWNPYTASYSSKGVEVDLGNYPAFQPKCIYSLPLSYSFLNSNKATNVNADGIRIYISDPFYFDNRVTKEDLTDLALCIEEVVKTQESTSTNRTSLTNGYDLLVEGIIYKEYANLKNSVRLLLVAD